MKILGIIGSSRKENTSGVSLLVKTVLKNTGMDYESISLRGKKIGGCVACLGCVTDNVCRLEDDMSGLRGKILEADAYVIGTPNYFTSLNALTHAFLERWYQFRHQSGDALWGKLAVAVGVGGSSGERPAEDIEKFMNYNFIETVAKVSGQGAASCFSCGFGETCQVGVPAMLFGPGARITEDMIPGVHKQPEVLDAAAKAGRLLGERLRNDHDRQTVTRRMMEVMGRSFRKTT